METLYFILGMLSIIATAIIATIVWGVVKINKQQQRIIDTQGQLDGVYRYIEDRFNGVYQEMMDRGRSIDERIDKCEIDIDKRFNDVHSYVDSRIDRASGLNGAKQQLIKG